MTVVVSILTVVIMSLSMRVAANEKALGGGVNVARLSCHETHSKTCWNNGRGVNCGPIPAALYTGLSINPDGYLAGAYGIINSDALPGGCPHIATGQHFTMFVSRTYDNWKSQQSVKLHVDVVDTAGQLTLNTRLDDGGGCNLPVTMNAGDNHYGSQQWQAEADYAHHCW